MITIRRKRGLTWLLMLGLLILGIASVITVNRINAQGHSGLSQRALQIDDLPNDSILLSEGARESDAPSHPLSLPPSSVPEAGREALYSYEAVYSFSGLSRAHGAIVSSFLYQYPSSIHAEKAATILTNDLVSNGQEFPLDIPSQKAIQGSAFSTTGDAGDRAYWFVGVSDEILYLIMANGMEDGPVAQIFRAAVQRTVNK